MDTFISNLYGRIQYEACQQKRELKHLYPQVCAELVLGFQLTREICVDVVGLKRAMIAQCCYASVYLIVRRWLAAA